MRMNYRDLILVITNIFGLKPFFKESKYCEGKNFVGRQKNLFVNLVFFFDFIV